MPTSATIERHPIDTAEARIDESAVRAGILRALESDLHGEWVEFLNRASAATAK